MRNDLQKALINKGFYRECTVHSPLYFYAEAPLRKSEPLRVFQ